MNDDLLTVVSMALTALDLGDIYMTVISQQNFNASVRSLTFREFWEVFQKKQFLIVIFLTEVLATVIP